MSMSDIILLLNATWETIYMVLIAGLAAIIVGLPLGILLFVTRPNQMLSNKLTQRSLAFVVNIVRSIPFIILLVALVPFTRFLIGTAIGTTAALIPLSIAAIPFVGRITENAFAEVSGGLIEAGLAMGASHTQIIRYMLMPESYPGIIRGLTVMLITLVGYSAMAGAIGGGGLGAVAINYGYQRFEPSIMLATVIILILIVNIIQWLGDYFAKKLSHA